MSIQRKQLDDVQLDQVTGGRLKADWDRSKPGAPSNQETQREADLRRLKELLNTPVDKEV